jgi:hypothetical protein
MRRASGALLALAVLAGCGGESSSEPPKGRDPEVRRMEQLGAATIRYLKRTVSAYEAGDVPAAKRALRVNVTTAMAYAKAARRLGLEECGSEYVYPGG